MLLLLAGGLSFLCSILAFVFFFFMPIIYRYESNEMIYDVFPGTIIPAIILIVLSLVFAIIWIIKFIKKPKNFSFSLSTVILTVVNSISLLVALFVIINAPITSMRYFGGDLALSTFGTILLVICGLSSLFSLAYIGILFIIPKNRKKFIQTNEVAISHDIDQTTSKGTTKKTNGVLLLYLPCVLVALFSYLAFMFLACAPILSFKGEDYILFDVYPIAYIPTHILLGVSLIITIVWFLRTINDKTKKFSFSIANMILTSITGCLLFISFITFLIAPTTEAGGYYYKFDLSPHAAVLAIICMLGFLCSQAYLVILFVFPNYRKVFIKMNQRIYKTPTAIRTTAVADNTVISMEYDPNKEIETKHIIATNANVGTGLWTTICKGMCAIFGLESKAYHKKMDRIQNKALNNLKTKAAAIKADAIVDVTFTMHGLSVIATATAVKYKK